MNEEEIISKSHETALVCTNLPTLLERHKLIAGKDMNLNEVECIVGHVLNQRFYHRRRYSTMGAGTINEIDYLVNHQHHEGNAFDDLSLMSGEDIKFNEGTSWYSGIMIMANCTIGMGLLNFPSAILRSGGILPALIMELIVILLIIVSLCMTCFLSRYYGEVTYQGMISSFLGTKFKIVARILIFVNNFMALIIFLVVIGDLIEQVIHGIYGDSAHLNPFFNRKYLVPIIATVFIFPLCLFSRFEAFKYTSFIGVIAAAYVAFGLIMVRYFVPYGTVISHKAKSTPHIMKIIPLICFAFECHIEMPPMIASLKKPNFSYSLKLVIGYVLVTGLVYTSAGIFGYLSFGGATPDDILVAYDPKDVLVIIAFILLGIKVTTTYPVMFYCIRIVIQDYVSASRLNRCMNDFGIRMFTSLPIFISSVVIAVFVPTITSVISFIGGISGVFVFILPGLCVFKLYSDDLSSSKSILLMLLGGFFVTLGTFLTAMVTVIAVIDYIE